MLPLTNLELLHWLMQHESIRPLLGGVYCRDTLPVKNTIIKPTLLIVNTAKSNHPTGIHWVGMFIGIPVPEFFDPLGRRPCHEFITFLGPHYICTAIRVQSLTQPTCGYFCLMYCLGRSQGSSLRYIVNTMCNVTDSVVVKTVRQFGSWALQGGTNH
jgi:hypothetical protein